MLTTSYLFKLSSYFSSNHLFISWLYFLFSLPMCSIIPTGTEILFYYCILHMLISLEFPTLKNLSQIVLPVLFQRPPWALEDCMNSAFMTTWILQSCPPWPLRCDIPLLSTSYGPYCFSLTWCPLGYACTKKKTFCILKVVILNRKKSKITSSFV